MAKKLMTDVNENGSQQPADANVDEANPKWKSEDDIRQEVITNLGLDEDIDSDTIDKVTKDKVKSQSELQEAIKSKQNWRDKAQKVGDIISDKPGENKPAEPTEVEKLVKQTLEKERLDSLDISDEMKREVETYAKITGLSVKSAYESDYIKFKKEQADQLARTEAASIGKGSGSGRQVTKNFSEVKPEDFSEMSDEDFEKFKETQLEK